MKIIFRQIGGTKGVLKAADIDCDHLPLEEGTALRDQVTAAGLLEAKSPPPSSSGDTESYYLEVVEGKKRNTLIYTDLNIPPSIKPLIQTLSAKAKLLSRKQ